MYCALHVHSNDLILRHILVDLKMISTVFSILVRAAVSGVFIGLQLLTAELYPTSVRHRMFGYSQGIAGVFSVAGPYIGGGLVRV